MQSAGGPRMQRPKTDSLTMYEHALAAAMHDLVDAFQDNHDTDAARQAARETLFWLTSAYGRDAVRDLVELLAQSLARTYQPRARSGDDTGQREGSHEDADHEVS
ncbi:hypothetical protein [Pseudonocardia sp. GCM10023141]|uniref:hypothetical protein n=1 Tax=Pseudonocardia sp. GCM10023141 TaxID=3252653 RepID=UPI00361096DF